jgi:asparagine synthase (glutamine-hydrolysing)
MCGIAGIIRQNNKPVENFEIAGMMQNMKHRGPDDEGLYLDRDIGLGHVRLSIIDLSQAGRQPMFSRDGRYCIVYNGEVYNYIELRDQLKSEYQFVTKTDTEVVLYSYLKWGKECLHRFNGMFAFAVYDTKRRSIFIARDRFGIKPLYYTHDKSQLIFASEQRAILPFLKYRIPQDTAILEFLLYNRTDQNQYTFFKDIHKIPHGSYAVIKDGKFRISKWYDLENELKDPFYSSDDYYEYLKQAVRFRLRSDVPVGVCLSGGLDSSSIVSVLIEEFGLNDLNTFSAVYGSGEKADESEFIDEYREKIKNMHFTYPTAETLENDLSEFINCHSEPVATLGPYAQFKVMQLAAKYVKVTLDGQGADEQLAGYHYFFGALFKELLLRGNILNFVQEAGAYLSKYKSLYALKYTGLYLSPSKMKPLLSKTSHDFINEDFFKQENVNSSIHLALYNPRSLQDSLIQHFEHKLEHLLKWEDHNSMWHSIESRVPFLDFNLVEKTLSLPSSEIIAGGTTKVILRKAMRGILPDKIRKRKDKLGFATPWEKWLSSEKFKDYVVDILSSKKFLTRGYLNSEKCLNGYQNHLNGKNSIPKEIWKWIGLELWYREFIDNSHQKHNRE